MATFPTAPWLMISLDVCVQHPEIAKVAYWELDPSKPVSLCDKIIRLITALPQVRSLSLDLRDLDNAQVGHMVTLLHKSTNILPRVRQVKFISAEDAYGVSDSAFSPSLCGRLTSAFCTAMGTKADELTFIRGCDAANNQVLLDTMTAFADIQPGGSPRRQLRRLLIAGLGSATGLNILPAREILETVVAPHSETIETIFIADDVDFAPSGGHQDFNTNQKAIDHLVNALAGMPALCRVAFPVVGFRVEGVERQDDKNLEKLALGTAMRAIAGGV
ncbi:uncharacterized protein PODANS_6_495 [Podospora anserina S mat+]|uniref:Podospora anserina S mat+ genomic DNA chromosome 6, supercontig 2 n=1 Tax=Podospora anserina (strain S / ATCC MYA-4624 / DSM 980 / FGSC 10383) TaxID=515849 RepID=B2B3B9_PODAN|nr:uncharacterized protein PODANS_6_495 [Podospora anserina S mat+]CAP71605.1 unnamed protein product [Podospora anserina S mat+]CDP31000.1 Putative protein of unknown function [Podospora anserina S mat+]